MDTLGLLNNSLNKTCSPALCRGPQQNRVKLSTRVLQEAPAYFDYAQHRQGRGTGIWHQHTNYINIFLTLFLALSAISAQARPQYHQVTGIIENIEPKGGRLYLIVVPTQLEASKYINKYTKKRPEPLPVTKLRISASKRLYSHLKIADAIKLPAMLRIPDPPIAPNGFDWRAYLQRKGIDATGYVVGKIEVLESATDLTLLQRIKQHRLDLAERLFEAAPTPQSGAFAAALLTGVRGYLSKDTVQAMRDSGLAHLLAISGMHMAMVAGLVYMLVRRLLAFQYRVNGKKIAAYIALIAAFGYLLLAGAPVSTQRAFIMTAIVLLAVLVDRQSLSLWSLGLAAIAVLAIDAQAILGVGFQLSFAAAGVLILYYRRTPAVERNLSMGLRVWRYFTGLFIVTLFINLLTGPIVAYHFHQVPTYGALGNLVAIPLTGLLIMPFLMLALFLLPFGWEHIALSLAHWPLTALESTAKFLADLPHAIVRFGPLPLLSVFLMSGGLLLILILKRYRYAGLLPVTLGLYLVTTKPLPDYIVTFDGKMLGKLNDDSITAIGWKPSKFIAEKWAQHYGKADYSVRRCKEDPCKLDHYALVGMYKSLPAACALENVTVITKLKAPKTCTVLKPTGQAMEIFTDRLSVP